MKRIISLTAVIVIITLVIAWSIWFFKPIGTIEGPEWDILHIDGVTYISEKSAGIDIPFDRSDKGHHLGIVKSGEHTFHIYSVDGDPERNYVYWTWEWEGEMFIRKELADSYGQ